MSIPKEFLWGFAPVPNRLKAPPKQTAAAPPSGTLARKPTASPTPGLASSRWEDATTRSISTGIVFYKVSVDDLLAEGMVPFVTLFHWDLPDALDKRYGGLNKKFVADYAHYAGILFEAMPRVKHWSTINEPWCSSILRYKHGQFAPGHTTYRTKSSMGDSSRECWQIGHNLLLAHGTVVKIYREETMLKKGGEIGITLNDPIYKGHYPASMKAQLGDRLHSWIPEEIALVQGSNRFYGINHYTANYMHKTTPAEADDFLGNVDTLFESEAGQSIGPETHKRYDFPKMYCTENGTSLKGENEMLRKQILDDECRADLMDNFEWAEVYEARFSVAFVDYEGGQKRYLKKSAKIIGPLFESLI
ncbi:glycosyl hydrolase family 1 [Diplocarpon mali]|nr:glycosyl hydrolase family 1 [Diplocarpon mali]